MHRQYAIAAALFAVAAFVTAASAQPYARKDRQTRPIRASHLVGLSCSSALSTRFLEQVFHRLVRASSLNVDSRVTKKSGITCDYETGFPDLYNDLVILVDIGTGDFGYERNRNSNLGATPYNGMGDSAFILYRSGQDSWFDIFEPDFLLQVEDDRNDLQYNQLVGVMNRLYQNVTAYARRH